MRKALEAVGCWLLGFGEQGLDVTVRTGDNRSGFLPASWAGSGISNRIPRSGDRCPAATVQETKALGDMPRWRDQSSRTRVSPGVWKIQGLKEITQRQRFTSCWNGRCGFVQLPGKIRVELRLVTSVVPGCPGMTLVPGLACRAPRSLREEEEDWSLVPGDELGPGSGLQGTHPWGRRRSGPWSPGISLPRSGLQVTQVLRGGGGGLVPGPQG